MCSLLLGTVRALVLPAPRLFHGFDKPIHYFATCAEVPLLLDQFLGRCLGKPMRVEAPSDVKQGQSFTLPLAGKTRSA
jgi:hypothetical protein